MKKIIFITFLIAMFITASFSEQANGGENMANYREDIANIELSTGNIHRSFMARSIGAGDEKADRFGVRAFRNGVPEVLSGTCNGLFVRADGTTVTITNGVVSGNLAYVTLPEACYAVEGCFCLAIKVITANDTVTLRIVDGMVSRTSTNVIVDPGTIIPSIEELIAAIEAAIDSIPSDYSALLTTIAGNYSSSKTYDVGDYAWEAGVLKKCIVPITTPEAYTAAHWTNAVACDDVSTLNSEIKQVGNELTQVGNKLNQKNVYMPGAENGYTTGAGTTYLYILTDGNKPVLIPKGSTIAKIKFVNSSTAHHSVALYFFERQGWNFKCVKIISGCNIDGGRVLDIDASAFDTDVYIGIKNEIAYGIKFYEGTISDRTSGVICAYNGTPSVGGVITPSTDTSRYFAFNIQVDIYVPENRESNSYSGNNTFLFKNSDIVSEISWITGKGFVNDTFDTATTISNFQHVLVNSSVGDTSEAIPIRDNDGNLINDIKISDTSSYMEAFLVAEFDRNGIYIRTLTTEDFVDDGFSSDCFYAVLRRFTNYDTRYYIENTGIAWLAGKEEYTVGANGDFETFTEMLIALKDNANEKTVYVSEGVYDIYEEMGGDDFLATITNPGSLNWRDVCNIVPDNTTIIGIGKVVLTWEPSASAVGSDAMAFLFSPLNLSGSATIENIEIHATNCRYAIHDETSSIARWKNVNRKLKNVHAIHTKGTYHPTTQCYGAGIAPTGVYEFENCIFENDADWFIFSMHATTMGADDKTVVNIKNCIIRNTDSMSIRPSDRPIIGFGSVSTEQRYIDVNIDGCFIAGNVRKYPENDAQNIVNAFKLVLIGNNAVDIQSTTATDALTPIKCNEFAN